MTRPLQPAQPVPPAHPHRPAPGQAPGPTVAPAPLAPAAAGPTPAPTPTLPLPQEPDLALAQTAEAVDPVIRQAHDDIVSGQVDTDMHATPGLDAERRRRLVPGSR